ncbi:DUF1326 domain-containing protein [Arhodomonas sp. AD133]|uniref:DUF1326 domain-containing protein n=1 Tax=Arhodomonas sp. AD133 TaxID=3415009 RepID=UPI003EBF748E
MGYRLSGKLLEVCTCEVLCPCWIGEDPDRGTCDASLAYHFESGDVDGVDVSGVTVAYATHIPGNVLAGNWRLCVYISDNATDEQQTALLAAVTGERGGPLADLAQLVGEVVSVERVPIRFDVSEGRGTYRVGDVVDADIEPYRGPSGEPTQLVESVFSTIPGSPAFVGKALTFRMRSPRLGLDVDLRDHNAIQGDFHFEA